MFGKNKKRPVISEPKDFVHRVHTGYDPVQGKFVGLPQQWQSVVDAPAPRRPTPLIDPSRVTPMEIEPLKVEMCLLLTFCLAMYVICRKFDN